MNKEQAVSYLRFSGFSDEQIKAIEGAFTCEDAISRQAVLKIIDGWYDNNRDTENIEDLIVLITYMSSVNPQKPNAGWIPVSERLPEIDGRYLAYIVNEHERSLKYIMTCELIWNSISDNHWFPDDECASNNVIAWMPLPEPYKAEGSGE